MQQSSMGFAEDEDNSAKVMVLGNHMIHPMLPQDGPQLSFKEISSPLNAHLLDFCDPDLFAGGTHTTSEAASCSNCCYEENNSYSNDHHSLPPDMNFSSQPVNEVVPKTNTLSLICDLQNDLANYISASINFSPCPQVTPYFTNTNSANPQDGLDFSQIQVTDNSCCSVTPDALRENLPYPMNNVQIRQRPPQLPAPVFEDDCLSSMHSFLRMNPAPPTCSWLDFSLGLLSDLSPAALSMVGNGDGPVILGGSNLLMGSEWQIRETDFTGDSSGLYCPDSLQRAYNSNEIQALCGEGGPGQWMRPGATNENNLSKDLSRLEEPNYKVGKLALEQRKEKIHRYMTKRNERNFSKKIKYACRKTLADSRPRVRGRFAKNSEYVGHSNHRANYCHHEEDDDDSDDNDVHVKDEEDILDSDIFAHISGVNSFKFSNPIQSWISK